MKLLNTLNRKFFQSFEMTIHASDGAMKVNECLFLCVFYFTMDQRFRVIVILLNVTNQTEEFDELFVSMSNQRHF